MINHLFCSLHQCKFAGFTLFFVEICILELTFSNSKWIFVHSIRSKQFPQAWPKVIDSSCGSSFCTFMSSFSFYGWFFPYVGWGWQVWRCWKECVKMDNFALQQILNRIPLLKFRYLGSCHPPAAPFPFRLCAKSWQWHFCYYQHATQQYAGWTLDHDCKFPTWIVFCRLSWM